jgi:predicted aldo/keto reductase-like oxidoreductase
MRSDLDRFRNEVGTEYLDIVLLHAVTDPKWRVKMESVMDVLSQAREDSIIRAHGISCHSIEALKTAADEDWVQVDLARMNPAGLRMDDEVPVVQKVLQKMKSKGKGIIGMKILGAGQLSNKVDEALQYALAQDYMDCFTIGSESIEQFNDLTKRIPAASVRG